MGQYPSAEKRPYTDKAAAAAHEAAARLSQKLAGGVPPGPQQNSPARQITTETTIPDRFVGLGNSFTFFPYCSSYRQKGRTDYGLAKRI